MHNEKPFLSAQAVGKPAEWRWKWNPFHVGAVCFRAVTGEKKACREMADSERLLTGEAATPARSTHGGGTAVSIVGLVLDMEVGGPACSRGIGA